MTLQIVHILFKVSLKMILIGMKVLCGWWETTLTVLMIFLFFLKKEENVVIENNRMILRIKKCEHVRQM